MPFEGRVFEPAVSKGVLIKYGRSDLYLIGSDPMWADVGLKLRDIVICHDTSEMSQLCKLEVKHRSVPTTDERVDYWTKIVKCSFSFTSVQTLDKAAILERAAGHAASAMRPSVASFLREQLAVCDSLRWVCVDKKVSKTSIASGEKEHASVRISMYDAHASVDTIRTMLFTTQSVESFNQSAPAVFLTSFSSASSSSSSEKNNTIAGYPFFLQELVSAHEQCQATCICRKRVTPPQPKVHNTSKTQNVPQLVPSSSLRARSSLTVTSAPSHPFTNKEYPNKSLQQVSMRQRIPAKTQSQVTRANHANPFAVLEEEEEEEE